MRAACGQTKACKSFLHHLEECGERLAEGKTMIQGETCVEELCALPSCSMAQTRLSSAGGRLPRAGMIGP